MRSIQRGPSAPITRTWPLSFLPTTSAPQGPGSVVTVSPSRLMPSLISSTDSAHWPGLRGAAKATGVIRPTLVTMCSIRGPCSPISTCTWDSFGSGMRRDPRSNTPMEKSLKSKVSISTESPSKGPVWPLMASCANSRGSLPEAAAASAAVSPTGA